MCLAQCLQSPPCPDPALPCEQHLNVTVGPLGSPVHHVYKEANVSSSQRASRLPGPALPVWGGRGIRRSTWHDLTFQEDLPLGESLR